MINVTGTTDSLQMVTATAALTDAHVSYVERNDTGPTFSPLPANTTVAAATTTTILAAPGTGKQRGVKTIFIRNRDLSLSQRVLVKHVISAGVTAELFDEPLGPGETLIFSPVSGLQVLDVNGALKTAPSIANLLTKSLAADQSNSTVTLTEVAGLTLQVPPGTYQFQYMIRYQAGATTTGVRFSVNHDGTVTMFVANVRWVASINATSSDAPSQAMVAALGGVVSAFSARAKSTTGWGTTLSVDAANSDMLTIIEGTMIVTVAGDIELWHGSEVAAASTVKAGSSLFLVKVA